jgi:hypothetical protein
LRAAPMTRWAAATEAGEPKQIILLKISINREMHQKLPLLSLTNSAPCLMLIARSRTEQNDSMTIERALTS